MDNSQNPSPLRVFQNEYQAFLGVTFPLVFWAIWVYLTLTGRSDPASFLYYVLVVTLIGGALFAWRYATVSALFANGAQTPAVVSAATFYRGWERVSLAYSFRGQRYETTILLIRNARSACLTPGTPVDLLIDPGQPRRIVVRDLY